MPKLGPIARKLANSSRRPKLVPLLDTVKTLKTVQSYASSPRLKVMAHNYKTYIKYSAGPGSLFGAMVAFAYMSDQERKMYNTEKLVYPVAGAIGGATLFATAPVLIIFAPITYLFGAETTGKIANLGLLLLLGSDGGSDDSSGPDYPPQNPPKGARRPL
jgi:hypothetical protein